MTVTLPTRSLRILGFALLLTACTAAGGARLVRAETIPQAGGEEPLGAVYRRFFFAHFKSPPQVRRIADPTAPWSPADPAVPGTPFPDGTRVEAFHDAAGRLGGVVRFREGRLIEAERYHMRRGALTQRVRYSAETAGVLAERTAYFDGEPVRTRYEHSSDGIRFTKRHTVIPGGDDGDYLVEKERIVFRAAPGSRLPALARARERAVGLPSGVLIPLRMGDQVVYLEERQQPGAAILYLVIHPDEQTARAAVRDSLTRHGGRALIFHGELPDNLHERRRNFQIAADGALFRFDPNRIFTAGGFRRQFLNLGFYKYNTKQHWIRYRSLLHRDGRRLARLIIEAYHIADRAVVAIHDNHSPMAWSRRIFRGEGSRAESRKAWHRDGDKYRTFFYVSEERDFESLRAARFSVILQDNRRVPDDGSAGVLFGRRGVRYFCLEVPRDKPNRNEHRRELNRMLEMTIRLCEKK